ncbi:LysR family transcriptional regulator [Pusillimonas sp. SM2304]|uniref:LysR family transcriptional regulator n=1 Tax=Pusillimonas sp. SM2304 TaxID=3073241 RepID=UPI0028751447|nr:LysR family transcriptional regulator [Pusillimonas sp. SM2304]MDS1139499.1 LysR family transcriptional regulator [Pusillimonas sp. SM2304]
MNVGHKPCGVSAPLMRDADMMVRHGVHDRARRDPGDPAGQLSWDDLRIVKILGECGNRAATATKLGINVSTVSRRVAQLEQTLGVVLFDRRRSGHRLTAEGLELRALAERVELDIVSVARRVTPAMQGALGKLRITMSDSLLLNFFTPLIADFKAAHAAIVVEVFVGNGTLNLARDESDIALRATKNPPESLVGRKLATIAWAPYGRAADFPYKIPAPNALYDQVWVSYTASLSNLQAAYYVESRVAARNISYRCDSVAAIGAAVAAGLGLGFLPCMLGDSMPGLRRVGPIMAELNDELWLLTHPDIRKSQRVRAFMNFCADAVARQKPLIEGHMPLLVA